jgi:rhomboid protease GluP
MWVWPQIGAALERDPAMLRGEWWRFVTTWLVLVDGWAQIVVNSIGLLVFGSIVEMRLGRRWWVAGYVIAGLAGEIAGLFWRPLGGGNSVAICGLIGLFSISQLGQHDQPLPLRYLSSIVWMGLGLWLVMRADIHGAALIAGFLVAAVEYFVDRSRRLA